MSDAKKRKTRSENDANTIDGTVISSRIVDANIDTAEATRRLEDVLTQVYDLLSDQAGDDWAILFHNSELTGRRFP